MRIFADGCAKHNEIPNVSYPIQKIGNSFTSPTQPEDLLHALLP